MFTKRPNVLVLGLLILLVALGVSGCASNEGRGIPATPIAQPPPTASVTSTAAPTATEEFTPPPTAVLPTLTLVAITSTPPTVASSESIELAGPLSILITENEQQRETNVSIFDLGTDSIRRLDIPGERLTAIQWFNNGCELYLNGDVFDLQGDLVWQVPQSVRSRLGNLNIARLSPDKDWLAYPVFSGTQTLEGAEFVDLEVMSLTSPFLSHRSTQYGGAGSNSITWSTDGQFVYYSDYDADGTIQVFRAIPDGQVQEQLTNHQGVLGRVNTMALSPDGRQLAYSIEDLSSTSLPYEYAKVDEGFIGIVDVDTHSMTTVELPKFNSAFDRKWVKVEPYKQ